MILQDVKDELVDDTQLHLVVVHQTFFRGIVAVEGNHPA
jgi:hypothetical protein